MMRRFKEETKVVEGANGKLRITKPRPKGLVLVHIGEDVWRVGNMKFVPGKGKHRVIYGPDNKEHHVWGADAEFGAGKHPWYKDRGYGDSADPAVVKVYILTHILDDAENWNFDLHATPDLGMLIKVVYSNGSVMTHKHDGEIKDEVIKLKRYGNIERTIKPIGWRYF